MACNKDSGCLTIADSTYPGLRGDINSSISGINSELSGIIDGLSGMTIPDDYLGSKVKAQLQSISSSLTADMGNVKAEGASINGFITGKIAEHRKHYDDWKKAQDALKLKKKKKKKDTDKNTEEEE